MKHNELLLAISDIMDKKLDSIHVRLDSFDAKLDYVEEKLSADIARLDSKIDAVEERLDAKINAVEERIHTDIRQINLTLENIVIPRISHIEQCYVATSERYTNEIGRIDGLAFDVQVIKSIVQDHSVRLQQIS